jgi:hypothetical protein
LQRGLSKGHLVIGNFKIGTRSLLCLLIFVSFSAKKTQKSRFMGVLGQLQGKNHFAGDFWRF